MYLGLAMTSVNEKFVGDGDSEKTVEFNQQKSSQIMDFISAEIDYSAARKAPPVIAAMSGSIIFYSFEILV